MFMVMIVWRSTSDIHKKIHLISGFPLHRVDKISKLSSINWSFVFFIGWPLAGGDRATDTPCPNPRSTLSPSRDGGHSQESIRDTTRSHGAAVEDFLGDIVEEETSGCMAGKETVPLLSRRNSVARCSGVMEDMRGVNRLRIPRNRAATDNEFASLMERIQEECIPALSSKTPSRKSLPAGALKSYMRGTLSSVRRSHGSSVPQSSQDDSGKPEGGVKRSSQGSNKQPSLQRKKIVPIKPSIPPVLLKARGVDATIPKAEAETSTKDADKKTQEKQQSKNTIGGLLEREGSLGEKTLNHCGNQCKGCQLVDLWFTFWHLQFNETMNTSVPLTPSFQHTAESKKSTLNQ